VKRWGFAFSRRWLGYLAFAVLFAIACGCLSAWQTARGQQAVAENALVARNFNATPVPLGDVLPTLGSYTSNDEWKRISVTGTYLPKDELLVRNRSTSSGQGYEVLTPLRLADGTVFIVDRGWVAAGSTADKPVAYPAPQSGTVTIVARLKPSEPRLGGQTSVGNQIPTIELQDIKKRLGVDMYSAAYGLFDYSTPKPPVHLTRVIASPPVADEGLHWSYMIQWIIFALIGFFGLGYAIRQEYRHRYEDDPDMIAREAERERRKMLKRPTDAEVEDELLTGRSRATRLDGPPEVAPVLAGGGSEPTEPTGGPTEAELRSARQRSRYGR
jgi:cytochrome oxidase assembly protein ShyY1